MGLSHRSTLASVDPDALYDLQFLLLCQDVKKGGKMQEGMYQVGRTRVYFRAGLLERLEEVRQRAMQHHAVLCQSAIRM